MTSCVTSIADAYATLGLTPDAGLNSAKACFRERVKHLHPDTTPATPNTLARLSEIVAAIRYLEQHVPACMEVEVTPAQARKGITRTIRAGGKPLLVRIPAGTRDGQSIGAIGECDIHIMIRIARLDGDTPEMPDLNKGRDTLDDFVDAFSRPSPNSRFANWIRQAQSAA